MTMRRAEVMVPVMLCALTVTTASVPGWSMEPPRPGEIEALAAAGELEARLEFARSIGNHRFDGSLIWQRLVQTLGADPDTPPPWRQGMPTIGDVKILAVLIAFSDWGYTNSAVSIDSELFGVGEPANFPYESLTSYYARSSYEQLDLSSGTTLGWYTTAYPRSAVPETREGREALIEEVLTHYDQQGHDFSQYDNDLDGVVDYFLVFWTGPDTGWGGFWWGYKTSFGDSTFTLDGKTLGVYSWQWESRPVGSDFSPVVAIHETGHALGLPDYYDYDDSAGPDGGVGDLDMMDANRGDHNCFSKWMLDWLTPTAVGAVGSQTLALAPSGTSQDAVVIMPGVDGSGLFGEYFMVQNRHKTGNDDQWFPAGGDGMLIWHVDARLGGDVTFMYDNSYTQHKLLRLMEADGLEEIEAGGIADAGDYYLPGSTFSDASSPSSRDYRNEASGVSVTDFSSPGASMSATFAVTQVASPTGVTAEDGVQADQVGITWSPVMGASHYRVYRATSPNPADVIEISPWQPATSHLDTTTVPATLYWYWVRAAAAAAGNSASAFSDPDPGWAGSTPPSLTTFFDGDNSSYGNTFDIEVLSGTALEIVGFEVNLFVAGSRNRIEVYYRPGTAYGYQDNPDGWTFLGGDDAVVSNGPNVGSFANIGGLTLEPGEVYGFYVHLGGAGNRLIYTDGGPTTFANADMSLTTHHGKGGPAPFTGATFYPRQWNGTVHYSLGAGNQMFMDGFESGDTSAWSATVP